MLDVFAQILAIVTLGPGLNPEWMAFIDNSAGQWAGTGVTEKIQPSMGSCMILSTSWSVAAHVREHWHFGAGLKCCLILALCVEGVGASLIFEKHHF